MPFRPCYPRVRRLPEPDLCCCCVSRGNPGSRSRQRPGPSVPVAPEGRPLSTTHLVSYPFSYPAARPGMTHRDERNLRRWIKPLISLPITGDSQRACGCADVAHRIAGSGRGGSGQPAVAALFSPIRCPFLVCAKVTCPHSPGGSEPASEANRFAGRAGRSGCRLLPGDQDEGTERDTGQHVQRGCGYSHAAIADRMAEN